MEVGLAKQPRARTEKVSPLVDVAPGLAELLPPVPLPVVLKLLMEPDKPATSYMTKLISVAPEQVTVIVGLLPPVTLKA